MAKKDSTTKHTPGPWDDASKYPGIPTVRIFARDHYIASVGNSDDTREQTEANARLIAAAPDLLATLKRSLDWLSSYPADAAARIWEDAREAVDKAEGR